MSFTESEEQIINQIVAQTNLAGNLPGEMIGFTITMPPFNMSIPAPPSFGGVMIANAQAATIDQAIDQIAMQLNGQVTTAETTIDTWLAGLGDYHRYFALYREAISRVKARLEQEP
jgi:hypothetical protein